MADLSTASKKLQNAKGCCRVCIGQAGWRWPAPEGSSAKQCGYLMVAQSFRTYLGIPDDCETIQKSQVLRQNFQGSDSRVDCLQEGFWHSEWPSETQSGCQIEGESKSRCQGSGLILFIEWRLHQTLRYEIISCLFGSLQRALCCLNPFGGQAPSTENTHLCCLILLRLHDVQNSLKPGGHPLARNVQLKGFWVRAGQCTLLCLQHNSIRSLWVWMLGSRALLLWKLIKHHSFIVQSCFIRFCFSGIAPANFVKCSDLLTGNSGVWNSWAWDQQRGWKSPNAKSRSFG